jgi:CheY-like chemotaxis protein
MTASTETAPKHKILLLDDDPDVLDLYQQMLLQLASKPEVHIASSGARAMALLDSEPFNVLVCDLNMPKMDGLQVIAIVRRKYPQLRTVIFTGVADEQMRARAYAMGIDLFLEKPSNKKELGFLLDCVESLLDKEQTAGFRGVQSKTLVDLIQLECLSGSSSVLKITNGKIDARIWITNGDVIDAQTPDLEGEEAFMRILSWKTGNFEIFPPEQDRPRRIHTSYQALLLNTAQTIDEAEAESDSSPFPPSDPAQTPDPDSDTQFFRKSGFGRIRGVEFTLNLPHDPSAAIQKWGLENSEALAAWTRNMVGAFQQIAEKFQFGPIQQVDARSLQGHIRIVPQPAGTVAIGMLPSVTREEIEENTKKVLERWAS